MNKSPCVCLCVFKCAQGPHSDIIWFATVTCQSGREFVNKAEAAAFLCIISVLASTAGYKTYSSAAAAQLRDSMYPDENETVRQLFFLSVQQGCVWKYRKLMTSEHNPPCSVFCCVKVTFCTVTCKCF